MGRVVCSVPHQPNDLMSTGVQMVMECDSNETVGTGHGNSKGGAKRSVHGRQTIHVSVHGRQRKHVIGTVRGSGRPTNVVLPLLLFMKLLEFLKAAVFPVVDRRHRNVHGGGCFLVTQSVDDYHFDDASFGGR